MTALLEFKQKLKGFYGRFEMIFQPIVKFAVALLYFMWINANMGYMIQLICMIVFRNRKKGVYHDK